MSQGSIQIIRGGNKQELFAQLSDIGRVSPRPGFLLVVRTTLSYQLYMEVNGVTAESGDGHSWLITGHIPQDMVRAAQLPEWAVDAYAYYNTRTRTGHLGRLIQE